MSKICEPHNYIGMKLAVYKSKSYCTWNVIFFQWMEFTVLTMETVD